ncbi:PRC-barrel domain-containing protein [Sphingobium sp. DEHP117]|uniref:PRC-barrel domain-containing protein n=1 Tax=Sphingobium sp. DEHP117 TaxID=2993436 RepID=UPI0027D9B89F|nr:PRC-barrel domain-containing protein [Sphingobium sp. DEHP117]
MGSQSATASLLVAGIDGLTVRSRDGDTLGHVKSLVVDKASGQSVYAILSLAAFWASTKATTRCRSRLLPMTGRRTSM